jgi:hypothetical protein
MSSLSVEVAPKSLLQREKVGCGESPPAELGVYLLEIKVILSLNPKLRIAGMG